MSAHKPQLIVKPEARADMRDTLLHSQERWGADQRRRCRSRLLRAMRSLLDFPELGRKRDEFFHGCRSLPVEQHSIFYYLTDENDVIVVRILHGRQDATGKVFP